MKKLLNLSLSLLLVLTFSLTAFATEVTPKVTFSAKTEKFTIENVMGTAENPDLFVGFKNVIPGDKITQNIDVAIKDLAKTDTVKLYLESETTDEVYLEFLKSINVTVKKGDEDITSKLSDNVLLGTFKADDLVKLAVTLEIPVTVGNEIKNLEGSTDWIFSAEILEDTLPQTGDTNGNYPWIILLVLSMCMLILVFYKKLKRN